MRDSNSEMIRAILIEKGVVEEVVLVKTVADTEEEIKSAILEACQDLDMLITSGGVRIAANEKMITTA